MNEIEQIKNQVLKDLEQGILSPSEACSKVDKLTPVQLSTGRVYTQKGVDDRLRQYMEARDVRSKIKEARIPFISNECFPGFWLSQGLIIVGAKSGHAKSTTCSNMLYGFLQAKPDKTAIVISNEEAPDAVYERAACISRKVNYKDFYQGSLPAAKELSVVQCVTEEIIPRVEVVDEGSFDMSYLEDVQAVLETAAIERVGIVLIDYLQVITKSRKNPDMEAFQISKELGLYLKNFGKKHGVPVVCFAQLSPQANASGGMAERVQNDKTFYNHGFACVEVVPDFDTTTTTFKVHKDRFFGYTGKEKTCSYEGGRYVFNERIVF